MKSLAERILIQQGDLTDMDTDAIVNAANNDLILGGGVAGAIRRKGGDAIQRECNAHCLKIANERGLKSIAFPAVGTGVAGFPLEECAKIMLREAAEHLRGETSLETVHFVLFDDAAKEIFQHSWKKLQAELASGTAGAKGA